MEKARQDWACPAVALNVPAAHGAHDKSCRGVSGMLIS